MGVESEHSGRGSPARTMYACTGFGSGPGVTKPVTVWYPGSGFLMCSSRTNFVSFVCTQTHTRPCSRQQVGTTLPESQSGRK